MPTIHHRKGCGKRGKGNGKEESSEHMDRLLFKQIWNKIKYLNMEKQWVKTRARKYVFQLCRLKIIEDHFGIFRAKGQQKLFFSFLWTSSGFYRNNWNFHTKKWESLRMWSVSIFSFFWVLSQLILEVIFMNVMILSCLFKATVSVMLQIHKWEAFIFKHLIPVFLNSLFSCPIFTFLHYSILINCI